MPLYEDISKLAPIPQEPYVASTTSNATPVQASVAPAPSSTSSTQPVTQPTKPAQPAKPATGSTQPAKTGSGVDTNAINKELERMRQELLKLQGTKGSELTGSEARDTSTGTATTPPPPAPGSQEAIQAGLDKLNTDTAAYQNSFVNQPSMVDTYKQLIADTGIQGLNDRLVNLTNIINGSEQDIRNEITSSGGTATESQIQAIVGARNKNLIMQAQSLQNLITSKQDYVDKIVTLTGQDRKAVSDRLDAQLGLDQKQLDMQIALQKTGVANNVKYQQMLEKQQNDAKARVQAMATTGALGKASDDRLAQLAQDSGYDTQDLKDMRDAIIRKDSLAQQKIQINLNTKTEQQQTRQDAGIQFAQGSLSPDQIGGLGMNKTEVYTNANNYLKSIGSKLTAKDIDLEWIATKKFTQTVNGPRFTGFRFASNSVVQSINKLKQLNDEFKRYNFAPANQADIYAATKGVGAQKDVAAQYIAQTTLLRDELGQVFMGGNSPTDKALELAQGVINSNYGFKQLNATLDTVLENIQFRNNSLDTLQAFGESPNAQPSISVDDAKSKYGITY